jgi:Ca2+-binding RTX toxin-like protein
MTGFCGIGGNSSNVFNLGNQRDVEQTREATVIREKDAFGRPTQTIIDAGKGNDFINPHTNADGSVDVYVNGEKHSFTAEEAQNLVIRGGKGNDQIVCTGETAKFEFLGMKFGPAAPKMTLDGGKGNDTIVGSEGNDKIIGGRGNDILMGGGGNDEMDGGRGNDQMWGGHGNDVMRGGKGHDRMWGGDGNDRMRGDSGNDMLRGGNGDDHCLGNRGVDDVRGGKGSDWVARGSQDRNIFQALFNLPSSQDNVKG